MTGLCAIFFLSGCAALLFESLWFRQTCSPSAAACSRRAGAVELHGGDRPGQRRRRTLRPPSAPPGARVRGLELAVGASGLALVLLLPVLAPMLVPVFRPLLDDAWIQPLRFGVAFLLLLAPAFAMGATLPLLVSAISRRAEDFGSAHRHALWVQYARCGGGRGDRRVAAGLGARRDRHRLRGREPEPARGGRRTRRDAQPAGPGAEAVAGRGLPDCAGDLRPAPGTGARRHLPLRRLVARARGRVVPGDRVVHRRDEPGLRRDARDRARRPRPGRPDRGRLDAARSCRRPPRLVRRAGRGRARGARLLGDRDAASGGGRPLRDPLARGPLDRGRADARDLDGLRP